MANPLSSFLANTHFKTNFSKLALIILATSTTAAIAKTYNYRGANKNYNDSISPGIERLYSSLSENPQEFIFRNNLAFISKQRGVVVIEYSPMLDFIYLVPENWEDNSTYHGVSTQRGVYVDQTANGPTGDDLTLFRTRVGETIEGKILRERWQYPLSRFNEEYMVTFHSDLISSAMQTLDKE